PITIRIRGQGRIHSQGALWWELHPADINLELTPEPNGTVNYSNRTMNYSGRGTGTSYIFLWQRERLQRGEPLEPVRRTLGPELETDLDARLQARRIFEEIGNRTFASLGTIPGR